jgi:hypothetical protein
MTSPRTPLTHAQYFPDPDEPVDRWFQADNAGNPRTTADFIINVSRERPALVVDPFCGSGSTSSAARLLGMPFYGIEADPVLACTTVAKTWADAAHAAALRASSGPGTQGSLVPLLARMQRSRGPDEAPVFSALAVLAAFREAQGKPLDMAELTGDLTAWPGPVPGGRVVRGDSRSGTTWPRLGLPRASAVLYTSPPFGPTSPVIRPPAQVKAMARAALREFSADTPGEESPAFPGYAELTLAMLRQAVAHLTRGTLIIEHEPGDKPDDRPDGQGADSTGTVIDAVSAEFPGVIHSPRIVRCGAFSQRGMLTLIVFDLR